MFYSQIGGYWKRVRLLEVFAPRFRGKIRSLSAIHSTSDFMREVLGSNLRYTGLAFLWFSSIPQRDCLDCILKWATSTLPQILSSPPSSIILVHQTTLIRILPWIFVV